jgi:hypothetical protein
MANIGGITMMTLDRALIEAPSEYWYQARIQHKKRWYTPNIDDTALYQTEMYACAAVADLQTARQFPMLDQAYLSDDVHSRFNTFYEFLCAVCDIEVAIYVLGNKTLVQNTCLTVN